MILGDIFKVLDDWRETETCARHIIKLLERRSASNRQAVADMQARISRRAAVVQLTGGASLATVLGSGAVRELQGGVAD